ncbi:MAG: hypothetical protein H8E76_04870 [Helicobacteraceae bacterium]|nr:hypothetical protein [Candidatus Sulfurimonas ponti]MBL6973528.1 hypothetical protein [Sulfurimonas sp.]
MITFNWDEYKEFKQHTSQEDKLKIAIDFMRSYYNISSPDEMYNMLKADELGEMMLAKRDINDAHGLENFMYQSFEL